MTQPTTTRPRTAMDLLPRCSTCGEPIKWDKVPSGYVRSCGHGGIVARPENGATVKELARAFKEQLPEATKTQWSYHKSADRQIRCYRIEGLDGLYSFVVGATDVWEDPGEGWVYARCGGMTRTFERIEVMPVP